MNLPGNEDIVMDNEYYIMSEVADNENVTQRELSTKLGVSVSTINVLINKMIREGLIKMKQVSGRQVLYMLTPMGIVEKARKTSSYLKGHYRIIYETNEKIKSLLDEYIQGNDEIYLLICDNEMGEILEMVANEYMDSHRDSKIKLIYQNDNVDYTENNELSDAVLLHMNVEEDIIEEMFGEEIKLVNIVERL